MIVNNFAVMIIVNVPIKMIKKWKLITFLTLIDSPWSHGSLQVFLHLVNSGLMLGPLSLDLNVDLIS